MVQNKVLRDAGVRLLVENVQNIALTPEIVRLNSHVRIDEPHKIRLGMGNVFVYLYDFEGGQAVVDQYRHAVDMTAKLSGLATTETFWEAGTLVHDRDDLGEKVIGWYITTI